MTIRLVPLAAERFPAWLERSTAEYTSDLVTTGIAPEQASQQADAAIRRAFRGAGPSADNAVFDLVDESEQPLGYLWVGTDSSDDAGAWWVWDIVVDAEQRGRGYGTQAMLLAEDYARENGAHSIGLSVFGFNGAARGLYESLGYETTSVKMRKRLGGER